MKGFLKRTAALICAAAVSSALAVGAFADHTFDFSDKSQADEILADTKYIDGTSAELEMDLGTDDNSTEMISIRCVLFGDYLESEFWNDPNVTVSIDVKLETEGANVIGYIPAFCGTGWKWINPVDYVTLTYGEWVTITTSGEHFYNNGFNNDDPSRLMFQLRSQWGEPGQGVVKISVKDFRIEGGSAAAVATTTAETTTTVATTAETTTTAEEVVEPVDTVTAEESVAVPTESAAASEPEGENEQTRSPQDSPTITLRQLPPKQLSRQRTITKLPLQQLKPHLPQAQSIIAR